MAINDTQSRRYCSTCRTYTLHVKNTNPEGLGCLVTIVRCGLLLPLFVITAVMNKPRCQACGSRN